jgi:hypothetical protein
LRSRKNDARRRRISRIRRRMHRWPPNASPPSNRSRSSRAVARRGPGVRIRLPPAESPVRTDFGIMVRQALIGELQDPRKGRPGSSGRAPGCRVSDRTRSAWGCALARSPAVFALPLPRPPHRRSGSR